MSGCCCDGWNDISNQNTGGGITQINGGAGISVANPTGPVTTVSGAALYARDGSNGPLTASLNMGGNALINGTSAAFTGQVNADTVVGGTRIESAEYLDVGGTPTATYNGVGLTTTGGGTLFLADDGVYKAAGGGGGSPSQGDQYSLNVADGAGGWIDSGAQVVNIGPFITAFEAPAGFNGTFYADLQASLISQTAKAVVAAATEVELVAQATPAARFDVTADFDNQPDGYVLTKQAGVARWLAAGGGSSTEGAVEGWELGVAENDISIWAGSTGGPGNAYGVIALVPTDVEVEQLSCFVTQGSNGANLSMAIYDAATGALLGETGNNPLAVGINTNPITGGPVMLQGGQAIYIVVWCAVNGARFLRIDGRWSGAGPTIAFEIPNMGAGAAWPANVSAFLSNKRNWSPWGAATST